MSDELHALGIQPIVNASGTLTRHSGSAIDPAVAAAMTAAAQACFDIGELQGRASAAIAQATGAEAGIVTAGASAGLLLGAAACVAGLDPNKMDRLPDTTGMRNEFIVPRSHRNSYDHSVRAAGVRLVEVGVADRLVGVGVRDTETWEIAGAINERTAGILYVARPHAEPDFESVVAVAQRAGLPVLVDAAAELPPASNLRHFIGVGADLVVFSGGKALGGPSASGILCGRRDLIASALLQQLDLDYDYAEWQPPREIVDKAALGAVPRHGIGRSCKVGKEQIVGLLLALRRFVATDERARARDWHATSTAVAAALAGQPALGVRLVADAEGRGLALVEVTVDAAKAGCHAVELAARLRRATPSVRVDTMRARSGVLLIVPTCLAVADAALIARAFRGALAS
jgi:L-seryl-tRNA(Ser) seleniumtransferase